MRMLEQLAEAAIQRDSLRLHSLAQGLLRAHMKWI